MKAWKGCLIGFAAACCLAAHADDDFLGEAAKTYRLLARDIAHWNETRPWTRGPTSAPKYQPPAEEAFNRHALIWPEDRDPLDVLLRRTQALADDLQSSPDAQTVFAQDRAALAALAATAAKTPISDTDARFALFLKTMRLRRAIAFKNPLLKSIDKLLFITREVFPTQELDWGTHICDQFFGFHARAKESSRGDGLYVLENPFSDNPKLVNLLQNRVVEKGPWKGRRLIGKPGWDDANTGGFLSPDVSFDGQEILFCYTKARPKIRVWDDDTVFHIFKCRADGSHLEQITSGNVNDLFPCWLPNGRVAFISERRGGFGRCHRREVPTYTLHSMFPDGTDITCLSPHETNEFGPSVDANGMIVYTRWDYVDRGFNQAHHVWITYPDGRDPREFNGNTRTSEWVGPHAEHTVRQIPGSRRYVATAAGHHTLMRGSLIVIDPAVPDDDAMSAVKRLTPDQLFPESEAHDTQMHHSGAYATAWPLSENYYLCVYDGDANCQYGPVDGPRRRYDITLLDAFGNKIRIYAHPQISCLYPMPLAPRAKPPVIPHKTLVGRPAAADGTRPAPIPKEKLPKTATIGVVDVRNSRYPFPVDAKVTSLRVWQVLPKVEFYVGRPRLGACDQTPGRQCLGTVPVEADGSAYFEAPVGVPLYFQALDENGCAVQTMRSDTYVAPGEQLTCNGCHEARSRRSATLPARSQQVATLPAGTSLLAMRRAPSKIAPEPDGSKPYNYPRLVQGVLDAKCVSCHGEGRKQGLPDLRAGDIAKNPFGFNTSFVELTGRGMYQYYTSVYKGTNWFKTGVQRDAFVQSYSEPGKVGARASKLYAMLKKGHHGVKLTPEEWRRLTVFMDAQGAYLAHDHDVESQLQGKIVPPVLE